MRIVKRTVFILIFMICFSSAFASQRLFDGSSNEYLFVKRLCQYSGVVGPSSALPVNGEELLIALERVDYDSLPAYLKSRYDEVYGYLAEEYKGFSFEIPIDVNVAFYLSDKQSEDRKDFFLSYIDEDPLLNFALKVGFSDYVFLETAMPIGNSSPNSLVPISSFNFIFDKNTHIYQVMPIVARGSFGNRVLSTYLGRTRHSMGSGYSGNMIVGDNYRYQEVLDLKFSSNAFTYNIAMTHFDSQVAKTTEASGISAYDSFSNAMFEYPNFNGEQQTRVVHRFDVNIKNKARAVLNLGTLYYASSNFDFRWFIPFMISHSYYNYSESEIIDKSRHDEANNIIGIELEYAVAPKYSLAFQLAMDQFQLPSEGNCVPDAFGFLLSMSYADIKENYDIELFSEIAYTMPFMYAAPKKNSDGTYNWNYDYYLGYFSNEQALNTSREGAWSGYSYGPNTLTLSIGADYYNHSLELKSKSTVSYIIQGDQEESINSFYISDKHHGFFLGSISQRIKAREDISYRILDNLEFKFGAEITYSYVSNKHSFGAESYFALKWSVL